MPANTPEKIRSNFFKKIMPIPESGCWIWMGKSVGGRYGMVCIHDNEVRLAHRYSWELHHSEIPPKMSVCHKCDIGFCVNPAHLFLGTHLENMRDRNKKNRHATCGTHGKKKLTDVEVREIYFSNESAWALSKKYNIHHGTISGIRFNKIWRAITQEIQAKHK